MNYYELTFTYTSPVETSIINDVLAAELGEIGFEKFCRKRKWVTRVYFRPII